MSRHPTSRAPCPPAIPLADLILPTTASRRIHWLRARSKSLSLHPHSRTLTTGKTDRTPNAWCVAPPPRPSGDLLPGAEERRTMRRDAAN
eukprot:scaffold100042_cov34-Phaeocystis_antarctica.AAC.3